MARSESDSDSDSESEPESEPKVFKILHLLNVLFMLFGVVLMGIAVQTVYNKYIQILDLDGFIEYSVPLILAGCGTFLIAICTYLGCSGEGVGFGKRCIILYGSFFGGIYLIYADLAAGIPCLSVEGVYKMVSPGMENKIKDYHRNNTEVFNTWNIAQTSLECCGIYNYTDWMTVYDEKYPLIPPSCCKGGATDKCTQDINMGNVFDVSNAEAHIYINGCLPKVVDEIAITQMGQMAICLAVMELVKVVGVILFVIVLICHRDDRNTYERVE